MTTYDFIESNKRKTAVLMVVFLALVVTLGWFIDQYYQTGGAITVIAGGYAVVSALTSYYAGDKMALLTSGAIPITEADNPYLYRMVENLCISTGTPMPKVHVINDQAINAFATGRDPKHASIAVTVGALQKLQNEELEGVLAHELSHIRNYDIRLMTVVIVLIGMISVISNIVFRSAFFGGGRRRGRGSDGLAIIGLVLIIFAPIVASLIKLAVSRRREYLADASGVLITRYPDGLANALRKIQAEHLPMARASEATAHLYIASPFSGNSIMNLFSTHPPIESRIAALEKMAGPSL